MVVLTRCVGDKIFVDDDIEITIVSVRGKSTRVGIRAPLEVKIYRSEIYERIKRERREGQRDA